jgi:hypothetical protein
MDDREDTCPGWSHPRTSGGELYPLRRVDQLEYMPHRHPTPCSHPNYDWCIKIICERQKMIFSAGVHPSFLDWGIHWSAFETENRVCQKDWRCLIMVGCLFDLHSSFKKQLPQILVSLVPRFIGPSVLKEISDIAKILANNEKAWFVVPEPLRPVAYYRGSKSNSSPLWTLPGSVSMQIRHLLRDAISSS